VERTDLLGLSLGDGREEGADRDQQRSDLLRLAARTQSVSGSIDDDDDDERNNTQAATRTQCNVPVLDEQLAELVDCLLLETGIDALWYASIRVSERASERAK